MKLSISQPNEKFKNVSSYIINQNLVNRQKVSNEDVGRIIKLQTIRKYFYDFIELSDDKDEIRRLDKIITLSESLFSLNDLICFIYFPFIYFLYIKVLELYIKQIKSICI